MGRGGEEEGMVGGRENLPSGVGGVRWEGLGTRMINSSSMPKV